MIFRKIKGYIEKDNGLIMYFFCLTIELNLCYTYTSENKTILTNFFLKSNKHLRNKIKRTIKTVTTNMNLKFLLSFLILLVTWPALAQISQPLRYEIEIDNSYDEYNIVSAEENGLFLFKELQEKSTFKELHWQIIRLDTSLQETSRREVIIDSKFTFKGYSYADDQLVLLFQEGYEFAKDLLFITFSIRGNSFQSYLYENLVPIQLTEFEAKNDAVIFGGNVNMRTVVMVYNFTARKGVVLPGFYNDRSSLLQISTDTKDDYFRVITSDRMPNKRFGISVRAYSTMGEQIFTDQLIAKEDLSLTDGRIVNSSEGGNLLAGTYSANKRIETSRGIFVADFNKVSQNQINYYNYGELENFFNYMRERKKERILKRIARKKVKGRKLRFSYRLFVQDIIKQNNENILIGEAYYPTYTNRQRGFDPYTMSASYSHGGSSVQAFDGYKYTHAVIMAFDNNGKLLWDNSFEINDLKSFNLEEHVHLAFLENEIVMLYLYNQHLKIKVIKNNEIVEGKYTEELRLMYENDEIRANDEDLEGLEHWYGNNFYAHGVNRVKNLRDANIKLNRKVFFINKIVVK
ncbi:hypothetical protein Ftrac_0798 [Marivirga tractuosa DSM 4126]|uniref:Uncharacterized protein n=2 Tax=Marivirga TaxID=869806 RepID=E4TSI0_MARTH|nr:hypothetical protein Ftrac_0798 [Marivirga tractuosa DSM 4126]